MRVRERVVWHWSLVIIKGYVIKSATLQDSQLAKYRYIAMHY